MSNPLACDSVFICYFLFANFLIVADVKNAYNCCRYYKKKDFMTWRKYINGMGFAVLGLSLVLLLLVNFTSPEMGALSYGTFFISLFLLLICLATIIGFYGRRRLSNNEVLYKNLKSAFRQGTLVALYITVLLILRAAALLNWWDAALLAVSVISFDMFFKGKL